MPIQNDISMIWSEKEQREDFFTGRATLENMTSVVAEGLARFKEIKAKGNFDTIPQDLKDAMLVWETIYDTAKTAFLANQDVQDIYNWRP